MDLKWCNFKHLSTKKEKKWKISCNALNKSIKDIIFSKCINSLFIHALSTSNSKMNNWFNLVIEEFNLAKN